MRLLIHGDNQILAHQSYLAHLDRAKHAGIKDIVRLDGPKLTPTDLIDACETQSLFGTPRLVNITNLYNHRSKKTLKDLVAYLGALSKSGANIIIFESKKLTSGQTKALSSFKLEEHRLSPVIFKFLDSVIPNNTSNLLSLYDQAVNQDSAEQVLYMLSRHLRQLLTVSDPRFSSPSWLKAKLTRQADVLGPSKLQYLYRRLSDIDWSLKSGQSVLGLPENLELLLTQI